MREPEAAARPSLVPSAPDETDRDVVLERRWWPTTQDDGRTGELQAAGDPDQRPRTGEPSAACGARPAYNWCFVELFVIPEQFRGQDLGSKLLPQAEDIARDRGCIGLWLDTYWFQAPAVLREAGL